MMPTKLTMALSYNDINSFSLITLSISATLYIATMAEEISLIPKKMLIQISEVQSGH